MKRMRRAKEDLGLIIGGEGRRLTCRQNDAFPSDHNWHLFCYRHSTAIQSILSYRCQFVNNFSKKREVFLDACKILIFLIMILMMMIFLICDRPRPTRQVAVSRCFAPTLLEMRHHNVQQIIIFEIMVVAVMVVVPQ